MSDAPYFDLPETEVILSEYGEIEAIIPAERNVAHRLIEEFMLLANETVARHLVDHAVPALHRVHEAPDLKKKNVKVDGAYVTKQLADIVKNQDLSRYIL